jgi:protein-disulfide isomerase
VSLQPAVDDQDHVQGPAQAPVTLVEYGDFECPHCGAAHPVVQEIVRALGDELRFVYRHFPLTRVHPHAEHAAEIAEAAGEHHKFWEMHTLLFEHQDALEDGDLIAYAESLGIDRSWATTALAQGLFRERVRRDFASGIKSGVNGTPTFFVNGTRFDGPWNELLETLVIAARS